MASRRKTSKRLQFTSIVTFIILWHFFFASSFILRLNPKIFWPVVFVISIGTALYNKLQISGAELEILTFSFVGLLLCFFAAEPWTAVSNEMYFLIYLCIAAMIAQYTNGEILRNQMLFFCIVHLVCIYLQVFFPYIYKSVVLPLLPAYVQNDIWEQMTYNSSYYGFTVQTSMTAMYMTFGAIMAVVNAKHEGNRFKKTIYITLTLLFVTGVLFATRRGSFLAIMLILAYIYFDTSKSKVSRAVLLLIVVLLLVYFGIDKIPGMQGMLDKFSRLSGNTLNGRQNTWRIAIDNLWNYPLFGYGVGGANAASGGSSVDNAYIAVLTERGIIGTIVFFTPYLHAFIKTYNRKKKSITTSKTVEVSFYFQLLFVIMSFMENYYGQALTMFVYYLMIFSEQFDNQRGE